MRRIQLILTILLLGSISIIFTSCNRQVSELNYEIPDVVWAAIIASLLTIGGVWLTNRNTRHLQCSSLQHDACQRDREREMELRREVFIPAAEAISNGLNLIGRLADLSFSDQEISNESRKNAVALARIEIISTNATIQATSALSQIFGTALLELTLKRALLIDRKNNIEHLEETHKHYGDLLEQLILKGNHDEQTLIAFSNNITILFEQKIQLISDQKTQQLDFIKLCLEHVIEVSKLIPPALFAVRDELELMIDKEAYMKTFNENLEKTKLDLSLWIEKISTHVEVASK